MIIVKVNGGLGNQLQQYAMYEKLRSLGKDAKLDLSWFHTEQKKAARRDLELDYFPNVQYESCSNEEIEKIIGKRSAGDKILEKLHLKERKLYTEYKMYDPEIFSFEHKVLEGYFACEAYYADILPFLQERLKFPEELNKKNKEMEEKIRSCKSVSLHIRRGDYLNPENKDIFGGICTEEYYKEAITWLKSQDKGLRFFIFSDDTEYVREKYSGEEYEIVDINHGKDSFYDMYLMSCCQHNICANSTFSFWGARLNPSAEKQMIRPLKQRNNCDWYEPNRMKELWKNWIFIDEKGKKW